MEYRVLVEGFLNPQVDFQRIDSEISAFKADMQQNPNNSNIDEQNIALAEQERNDFMQEIAFNHQMHQLTDNTDVHDVDYNALTQATTNFKLMEAHVASDEAIIGLNRDVLQLQNDILQNPQNFIMDTFKIAFDELKEGVDKLLETQFDQSLQTLGSEQPKDCTSFDALYAAENLSLSQLQNDFQGLSPDSPLSTQLETLLQVFFNNGLFNSSSCGELRA